jgi:hypothetical protein
VRYPESKLTLFLLIIALILSIIPFSAIPIHATETQVGTSKTNVGSMGFPWQRQIFNVSGLWWVFWSNGQYRGYSTSSNDAVLHVL